VNLLGVFENRRSLLLFLLRQSGDVCKGDLTYSASNRAFDLTAKIRKRTTCHSPHQHPEPEQEERNPIE
jgi:hypothetical protein